VTAGGDGGLYGTHGIAMVRVRVRVNRRGGREGEDEEDGSIVMNG